MSTIASTTTGDDLISCAVLNVHAPAAVARADRVKHAARVADEDRVARHRRRRLADRAAGRVLPPQLAAGEIEGDEISRERPDVDGAVHDGRRRVDRFAGFELHRSLRAAGGALAATPVRRGVAPELGPAVARRSALAPTPVAARTMNHEDTKITKTFQKACFVCFERGRDARPSSISPRARRAGCGS